MIKNLKIFIDIKFNGNSVNTARPVKNSVPFDVILAISYDMFLFCPGYRGEGSTEFFGNTRFDLQKNKIFSICRYYIYLAERRPVVPS